MKMLGISLALLVAACATGSASVETPTEVPAPVVVGSGVVTFGVGYDPDTLAVTQPKRRFTSKVKHIAWRAEFMEPADSTTLTLVLASVGKNGSERLIHSEVITLPNPRFGVLANEADLATIVEHKPGKYLLRYLRDTTVLAEGEFELV